MNALAFQVDGRASCKERCARQRGQAQEEEEKENGLQSVHNRTGGSAASLRIRPVCSSRRLVPLFVRYGDTVVLVNVTGADTPREGVDFFPLAVDFEEKQYSVGKIPGGFIKREGRPTEKATLTCRLIDRPLRPLFPKGMRNDVQVVATCLSIDTDIPPEVPRDARLLYGAVRQQYSVERPHGLRGRGLCGRRASS